MYKPKFNWIIPTGEVIMALCVIIGACFAISGFRKDNWDNITVGWILIMSAWVVLLIMYSIPIDKIYKKDK